MARTIIPRGAVGYNIGELMRLLTRRERPDFRWQNDPEALDLQPPPSYEGIPNMGMDRDPFTLMQELEGENPMYPRPTLEQYNAQRIEALRRQAAENPIPFDTSLAVAHGAGAGAATPPPPPPAVPIFEPGAMPPSMQTQPDLGGVAPGFSVDEAQMARIRAQAPQVLRDLMASKGPARTMGGGAFPETMPPSSGNSYQDAAMARLRSVPTQEAYDFSGARPMASKTGAYVGNLPTTRRMAPGEMGPPTPLAGNMRIYDIPEADMQQVGQLLALGAAESQLQTAETQRELDRIKEFKPRYATVADPTGQYIIGYDELTGQPTTRLKAGEAVQDSPAAEMYGIAVRNVLGSKPEAMASPQERALILRVYNEMLAARSAQYGGLAGLAGALGVNPDMPPDPAAIQRGAGRTR